MDCKKKYFVTRMNEESFRDTFSEDWISVVAGKCFTTVKEPESLKGKLYEDKSKNKNIISSHF